jgi:hypothetical protein
MMAGEDRSQRLAASVAYDQIVHLLVEAAAHEDPFQRGQHSAAKQQATE